MKLIILSIWCLLVLTSVKAGKLRIIGGKPAINGQFPHQISIRNDDNEHICGGSILDTTTILTAAHCVCRGEQLYTTVVAGTNQLSSGGNVYRLKSIKCHPNYNMSDFPNDIAIIKLRTPIQFSLFVQPIKLPTASIAENQSLVLSGWGYIKFYFSYIETTNFLQFVELNTINLESCAELLTNVDLSYYLTTGNVCTIPIKLSGGACHGDSGGALIGKDGIQHGIVSWSYLCSGRPDVFTSVFKYKDWIQQYLD